MYNLTNIKSRKNFINAIRIVDDNLEVENPYYGEISIPIKKIFPNYTSIEIIGNNIFPHMVSFIVDFKIVRVSCNLIMSKYEEMLKNHEVI